MSEILDVITAKLNTLNDYCAGIDTNICFRHSHDFVKLSVPPTAVGRELLRALLIEIGRHEQDKIKSQLRIFDAVVKVTKMPTV